MIYDTLSFDVTTIDMTPSEEFAASYPDEAVRMNGKFLIKIAIQLNSKTISWSYVDPYTLFFESFDDKPYWETQPSLYSSFEPFSCSCGSGGCAGIWNGIHVKVRGHSVEWRAKKRDGYKFLEKTYYNFSKKQYTDALKGLYNEIEKLSSELGDHFVIDLEYNMKTGKEFLELINSEVKAENKFWK